MNLDDPKVSRTLAKLVNSEAFYQLSDEELSRWRKALLKAKTTNDLPQDILKKIGWKDA